MYYLRSSKQCPQGLGQNSYLRTDKTEQSENKRHVTFLKLSRDKPEKVT